MMIWLIPCCALLLAGCSPSESTLDASTTDRDGALGGDARGVDSALDPDAASRGLRVFVTSTMYNGNLGGLAGADANCAQRAAAASLGGTGQWAAWLSINGQTNAIDRLTNDGPWRMVDGQEIAGSKADLVDGTIQVPLTRTELNQLVPSDADYAWTGTNPLGQAAEHHCVGWTSGSEGIGYVGEVSFTSGAWTLNQAATCNTFQRLICFEL